MRQRKVNAARSLRQRTPPAEAKLWGALRNRALGGFKFRRQHPVGPYVVDFACVECKMVVELDGSSHWGQEKNDAARSKHLEADGWQVLRFWNTDVNDDVDIVKDVIYAACCERSGQRTPPSP